jgi:hypothetical protein
MGWGDPDPVVYKAPDPGSGSATLLRNTGWGDPRPGKILPRISNPARGVKNASDPGSATLLCREGKNEKKHHLHDVEEVVVDLGLVAELELDLVQVGERVLHLQPLEGGVPAPAPSTAA